ncbi:MAG: HlyD family efflux transporter periplasmic adaptor subunit [Gammaproteobacteria bacterium]|nr:HlyD family efflux transporter periplasmic adaptor subunit [Gammaproteobacteria bacterium]
MKTLRILVLLAALVLSACADTEALPEPASPAAAPWAAIAKGRIDVEGGLISIAAARPGIVREVLAEEGQEVEAGAILARIDDREAVLVLAIRERERDTAERGLALLQVRLKAAERELGRLVALRGSAAVSVQELNAAQDRVAELKAESGEQAARLAQEAAEADAAAFEVEQHAVRAPLKGRIVRRQAKPGDGASTLNVTPLFLFAPDAPRIVRAELEESFVADVQAGMSAEIVVEADERQVYRAKVLRLGEVFGPRPSEDDPAAKVDVRVIECVLALDTREVRIGQRVIARIARSSN